MKTLVSGLTALTLAATLLLPATGTASAAPAAERTPTKFGMKASGYGTKIKGGQVPANSDTTANIGFACTNAAGIDKDNNVAAATLPDLGEADEVTTRIWTTRNGGVVASNSRSSVERVALGQGPLGELELTAITSTARAFHDGEGFDAQVTTEIGGVALVPAAGEPQEFVVPTPGDPLEIPGVATISIGDGQTGSNADGAKAFANGVKVELASGTTVRIAHTRAVIERGVKSGLMRGAAFAANSHALDENLQLGRNPLTLMPCRGTDGELRRKSLARVNLGDSVELRNLTSRQEGTQTRRKAEGYELGRVGAIEINDGELVLRDVVGRVDLVRKGRDLKRDVSSSVGAIRVQGEERSFDEGEDELEIPGVALLERNIVDRTRHGAKVIALRITLLEALDPQQAVLNIGVADLAIRPAAR
jgi:hypothetical protein